MSRIILIALLAAQIAGCGFHLRGAASAPPEMERTYIANSSSYTVFYRKLRNALIAAGIEVVESADEATAVLTILADVSGQRVVSVSARNVPREYEVWYTVQYEIVSGEKLLMPPTTQTLTRDYTYDETEVLGKSREEEVLRDALVDDLVRIALIQISAL